MKRLSIFQKVTILLSAAFGLMLLLGALILQTAYHSMREELQVEARANVMKSADEVDSRIQIVETKLRETAVIAQGMDYLLYEGQSNATLSQKQLLNQLTVMLKTTPEMDMIFAKNGDSLCLSRYSQSLKISERIAFTEILQSGEFPESAAWTLLAVGGDTFLIRTYTYGLYTLGTAVRLSNLESAFQMHGGDAFYSILSADGDVLFSNASGDERFERSVEAEMPIYSLGLTLQYTLDSTTAGIFASSNKLLLTAVLLFCIATVICTLIVMRRSIQRPIDRLLELTRIIVGGDYTHRIETRGVGPEFRQLNEAVNDMLDELCALKIRQYENELERKSGELRLLRNQIRPHFYLNAISMINNMTYQNRNEDIREYIACLSAHLRYTFSVRQQFVSLREEADLVENYIKMQDIRFPGSVHFLEEIAADCEKVPVVHLMLITIVENSFKYGMTLYEPLELSIKSERVKGKETDICRIEVLDNGPGFSQEALADFARAAGETGAPGSGGLLNIHRTLSLLFEGKDSMRIENRADRGARVVFEIPIREEVTA